jgi:hypothetical protein
LREISNRFQSDILSTNLTLVGTCNGDFGDCAMSMCVRTSCFGDPRDRSNECFFLDDDMEDCPRFRYSGMSLTSAAPVLESVSLSIYDGREGRGLSGGGF